MSLSRDAVRAEVDAQVTKFGDQTRQFADSMISFPRTDIDKRDLRALRVAQFAGNFLTLVRNVDILSDDAGSPLVQNFVEETLVWVRELEARANQP